MVTPRALLTALVLAALTACGADSSLPDPTLDGGGTGGSDAAAPVRSCAPNCTVGHRCCQGTCDGPEVLLPSDCCVCLPGEVSTFDCGAVTCGGG